MNELAKHRIKRIYELFASPSYRQLLRQRFLLWVIRKINPAVCYVGLKNESESLILHSRDNAVTPYILATGHFQKEDVHRVVEILKESGHSTTGLCLNVGANIGTTAIYLAAEKCFSQIYCFEPVPSNIDLFRANVSLNSLDQQITLFQNAVGNAPGSLKMLLSDSNCGDHRIEAAVGSGAERLSRTQISVPVTTIDEFNGTLKNTDGKISLVWSDTQGFEGLVLKGALNLIKERKPALCIEFWPYGLKNAGCLDVLIEILTDNYSKIFDLSESSDSALKIDQLPMLVQKYSGEFRHTDLLIIS